jgi:hypothetical protein
MPQSPLFDPPRDRLGARLHEQVFGSLPRSTARALDVPEVAGAVRPLLARGWRPAQLAARVGALPAPADPVPAVVAFLEQLLARSSPQEAWEAEQAVRAAERAREADSAGEVASEASRAHWVAEARRTLGLPARPRPVPAPRAAPTCASCRGEGEFFVTRQVRLCGGCVALLASGRASLAAAQVG